MYNTNAINFFPSPRLRLQRTYSNFFSTELYYSFSRLIVGSLFVAGYSFISTDKGLFLSFILTINGFFWNLLRINCNLPGIQWRFVWLNIICFSMQQAIYVKCFNKFQIYGYPTWKPTNKNFFFNPTNNYIYRLLDLSNDWNLWEWSC